MTTCNWPKYQKNGSLYVTRINPRETRFLTRRYPTSIQRVSTCKCLTRSLCVDRDQIFGIDPNSLPDEHLSYACFQWCIHSRILAREHWERGRHAHVRCESQHSLSISDSSLVRCMRYKYGVAYISSNMTKGRTLPVNCAFSVV